MISLLAAAEIDAGHRQTDQVGTCAKDIDC